MAMPKRKYILIVEDDPAQADDIASSVRQRFPRCEVTLVETESQFRDRLPEFALDLPAVAVIDVILAWTDPDHERPRPSEVAAGGIRNAGLRCEQVLRNDPLTARVPVILYTVTNGAHYQNDVSAANQERESHGFPKVLFLSKEPDTKPLLDAIHERLG